MAADNSVPPGITLDSGDSPPPQKKTKSGESVPPGITVDKPSKRQDSSSSSSPSWGSGFLAGTIHGLESLVVGGMGWGSRIQEPFMPQLGSPLAESTPSTSQDLVPGSEAWAAKQERKYAEDPRVKAHPGAAELGNIAGQVVATTPLVIASGGAARMPTLGERIPSLIGTGGIIGTAQPTRPGHFAGDVATNIAESAGGSAILGMGGEFVGAQASKIAPYLPKLTETGLESAEQRAGRRAVTRQEKLQDRAGQVVTKAVQETQLAKGQSTSDIMRDMAEAKAKGQPYRIIDIGESQADPVHKLGFDVFTGDQETGGRMGHLQKERTTGFSKEDPDITAQGMRLEKEVRKTLSNQSSQEVGTALIARRSQNARPLWRLAMTRPPRLAPYEKQLEGAWNEADQALHAAQKQAADAQRAVTQAEARDTQMAGTYGSNREEINKAYTALDEAEENVRKATTSKQQVLDQLNRSQEEAEGIRTGQLKAPVWSPRLQSVLDDPDTRRGIMEGWRIEQRNARAEGRPTDAKDFAIMTDANGNPQLNEEGLPVIRAVPNMQLIQMAKEGLDDLLAQPEMRDPLSRRLTKKGQSIANLRRTLIDEADRLNPDWKAARDMWSGDTAMMEALKEGRAVFGRQQPEGIADAWLPSEFRQRWEEMGPGEREAFKAGMADKIIYDLQHMKTNRDLSQTFMATPAARIVLRTVFSSEAEFDQFERFIAREAGISRTGTNIIKGSATAQRVAAREEAGREAAKERAAAYALDALRRLVRGPFEAGASALRGLGVLARQPGKRDPELTREIGRQLMEEGTPITTTPEGKIQVGPRLPEQMLRSRSFGRVTGGNIGAQIAPGLAGPKAREEYEWELPPMTVTPADQ